MRRAGSSGSKAMFVLGFIGSFFAWEGLDLLLEALPQVIARRPDIRLLLVGDGPANAALRAMVERLKLQTHVIFAGQVKHDDVAAIYDAVDVLVYPRTPMRLTNMVTPLKPLEAMAMGKVFVASDVGGHRELVNDRRDRRAVSRRRPRRPGAYDSRSGRRCSAAREAGTRRAGVHSPGTHVGEGRRAVRSGL